MKKYLLLAMAAVALLPCFATSPAQAQATRTWVSGVGDDANPCSRTAPCKTFAGAISKTAGGGEINCLDPGGWGAVTITKSIKIDCLQFPGGVLVSGTNGINISTTAGIKVILRGLEIIGIGTGITGVNVLINSEVTLDHVHVTGFTGSCVNVNTAGTTNLFMYDSNVTQCARGVQLISSGTAKGVLHNVGVYGMTVSGVEAASNGTSILVNESTIAGNGAGTGVLTSAGNGKITVSNSTISGWNGGANAVGSGSTIRLNNNTVVDNVAFSYGAGSGTLATAGNNRVDVLGATNGTFTAQ
jgi:hypothetical protein